MSQSDFSRRLRDAAKSVDVPPRLEARVRDAIAEQPRGRSSRGRPWGWILAPALAASFLFATALSLYRLSPGRALPLRSGPGFPTPQ